MGTGYLIDSNTVIDFFNGKLPDSGRSFVISLEPIISIITYIELFSSPNMSDNELNNLKQFVDYAKVIDINKDIALQTFDLRLSYRIKLPDAVIAATAIHHQLTLISRNISDFGKITELKVINPYTIS